ncbi:uncharacterized protein LOC112458564 isoform X3 [Temnothorax curvispinosus]|uniref:Uncharacterized protein LOC112458564 isoform X3 n=1 Tax=Temnothorax curvispinosus TaxID=300111 RepID=A0A6J1QB67_9HYME|nr:uncharacterized protein LOC112458564 isoform X3 [Temnothorax curvispinosus]
MDDDDDYKKLLDAVNVIIADIWMHFSILVQEKMKAVILTHQEEVKFPDCFVVESQQLIIRSINIPSAVKVGDVDHVILDCDYALENTSSQGLVVKWFFNDNRVVYQWIHGRSPLVPADEPAAKYIDLTYKASDDPFTEYRAMKLDKPGIELSGDYMCVISTFEDERAANASMVIYSTGQKFDFEYQKKSIDNKDGVEAMCKAEGLYPQPTLDISIKDIPEKKTSKPTVTLREDGLYNILSRVDFLDEELPEAAELKCILDIPRTNYSMTRKTIYYSGNFVDRASINLILLPILLAIFILFH